MSIKPKYIEKIRSGVKKYEFRKKVFKEKIERIYVYSSAPVKKIVGYFIPGAILSDRPQYIWEKCKDDSGLSEREFFKYFGTREKGHAIQIISVVFFKTPLEPFDVVPNFVAPQSFYYINNNELRSAS